MSLIFHQKSLFDFFRVQGLQFFEGDPDNFGPFVGGFGLVLENIFILLVEHRKMHLWTAVASHKAVTRLFEDARSRISYLLS